MIMNNENDLNNLNKMNNLLMIMKNDNAYQPKKFLFSILYLKKKSFFFSHT